MTVKLKIGVVGVGHLGSQHARVLAEIEESELVGVYDIDRERAKAVGERYGVAAFSSLEELLGETEAVSCAVPTESHYEVAREVLRAGRHLFLEKPMARTVKEAEELLDLAVKGGLKFQIGHIERFNPAVLRAQEFIKDPKFVEAHRLAPYNPRGTDVDVVLDLMIHDLDLLLHFMGKYPVKVDAVGVPVLTDKVDIANVRLEFEGGEIANVTASRVSVEKLRKIRLFQKDTYISIDYLNKSIDLYRKRNGEIVPFPLEVDRSLEPLKLELRAFVRSVLEDRTPPVSAEEGILAQRLAEEVIEKIKQRLERAKLL
ncbi:MAG TPA: Gfo/Idh/MocA family oxidoreductase [candidate division WOR-3 bacterium]|uniref:Gfo/Idh/MocA family oxidoreductase n=1 Tax=candidate division WOR-3 bacterium TaxID=2052148 RepID=A0A7C1BFW0_UNCW3|nr:Gfo/Idh/MocA family oxidoreductase [candidate division WOR-3 bacterium]